MHRNIFEVSSYDTSTFKKYVEPFDILLIVMKGFYIILKRVQID